MLIVCPNCATSYDVDVASLRPGGRRVRCVRCRTVWDAELPRAEKLIAAAEALAPARLTVEAVTEGAAATAAPAQSLPPALVLEPRAAPFAGAATAAAEDPAEQSTAEDPAGESAVDALDAAPSKDSPAIAAAGDLSVEVDAPSITPPEPGSDSATIEAAAAAPSAAPVEDVETVAARRYGRRPKPSVWHWPLARLQSGILALIVLDAIVVGWRADFVRAMPQTASFYAAIGLPVNLRGLKFDSLATTTEQNEGLPILVVSGNVANATSKPENVPHLRFAVRNAARQEIYSWTAPPPRAVLHPGEAIAFHTRLASPPPDAHDVLVRFVNRYDILTGTR